jgi:hypothetical protein
MIGPRRWLVLLRLLPSEQALLARISAGLLAAIAPFTIAVLPAGNFFATYGALT